jgi:hypothetical protein
VSGNPLQFAGNRLCSSFFFCVLCASAVSSIPRKRASDGLATLGWGVFCACSWTWCIGLFLPALMLDRYGWAGFFVFAIPNALGCAGFGYVLGLRRRSEAMVARHGPAMVVFSLVAIAYHMFFITLLFDAFIGRALSAAAIVFLCGLVLSLAADRTWLLLAAMTWLFSIVAFAIIGFGAGGAPAPAGSVDLAELAWLAPIICLGFLLCPYLDLTFHRALQRSPSRHAFGIFGAAFAVMIVFTCFLWSAPSLTPIAFGHILAQTIFTVGAHLREMRLSPAIRGRATRAVLILLPLAGAGLLPATRFILSDTVGAGVDLYIRFLVFYGLAFPAYVLLLIGPWRPIGLSRGALIILGAVIVLLTPLYELAFLHHRAWLMIIPTAAAALWIIWRLAAIMGAGRESGASHAGEPRR